jgi:hypothetical protein
VHHFIKTNFHLRKNTHVRISRKRR